MTTDLEADHHPADFLATTNYAFGPPSLKEMPFGWSRTSCRDCSMDLTTQPSATATSISFRVTRRGPCLPDSATNKWRSNSRLFGFWTVANLSPYRRRSVSPKA